jgi:hypothetical protein
LRTQGEPGILGRVVSVLWAIIIRSLVIIVIAQNILAVLTSMLAKPFLKLPARCWSFMAPLIADCKA